MSNRGEYYGDDDSILREIEMSNNCAIDTKSRYPLALALKYLSRIGKKPGVNWRDDAEKALNFVYYALHGKWPWQE